MRPGARRGERRATVRGMARRRAARQHNDRATERGAKHMLGREKEEAVEWGL